MPRLIPTFNSVANLLIPPDIKERVTGFFLEVSEPLSAEDFEKIVNADISIWRNILPREFRDRWKAEAKEYGHWIKLANAPLILGWIFAIRPDIMPALNTQEGKLWFFRQWAEITREIGI